MSAQPQETLDRTFHALGDGTRRGMLSLLAGGGECTAGDLGEPFDLAQSTASKHIRVLEDAGLVQRRVEGRTHRFRLVPDPIREAEAWLVKHRDFWQGSLDTLEGRLTEITKTRQAKKSARAGSRKRGGKRGS